MPVITINGQYGCSLEIGQEVARLSGIDYVDRQVLAEAGRRVGASVEVLASQETKPWTRLGRISEVLERAFLNAGPVAGDPLSSAEWESFMGAPYPVIMERVDDRVYFEVVSAAMKDLAAQGNVVIVGRAGNLVLKDIPGALHVRTVATVPFRVGTIMRREEMTREDAEAHVGAQENARTSYYRRFFKADLADPLLYDFVINVGALGVQHGAEIIAQAARLKSA